MKPVLFSVSYAGFWGQHAFSLEEFISHAKKLGYSGVELMAKRPHLSPLDWSIEKVTALKQICVEYSVEVSCIAAYTKSFLNWLSENKFYVKVH